MSAKLALYKYLTDPAPYPGHAAERFERTRTVAGIPIANRNEARQALRDKVGKHIYSDRIPQDAGGHTSIMLRSVSDTPEMGLLGEEEGSVELIVANVYAAGGDAATRADTVIDLLRLCVSGYYDDVWGDTYIGECTIDTSNSIAYSPSDASDQWTQARSLDLTVLYTAEGSPVYPVGKLTAAITVNTSTAVIQLSTAASTIVANRPLTRVQWVVRSDSAAGTVRVTIDGSPHLSPGLANVTGTRLEPVLARVALNLPGTFHATMTLTDETGAVSSAEFLGD